MEPYQALVELLMTHPGVQAVAAIGLVSEVGIDLSRFKSAKHFASWIGVCPGNHKSRRQT
jgi:transposase